jgi:hypothetical protein
MIVDVLYFEGCPNHAPARDLVERVLSEHSMTAEIRDVEVTDAADAQGKRFLGSPSVRIDGVDVDPSAIGLKGFGLMCRVYRDGNLVSGVPPRRMIENALTIVAAIPHKDDDV